MASFGSISCLILTGCVLTVYAPHVDPLVETALANLGMNYDHNICKLLEHLDCKHVFVIGDGLVCGSDDITYEDHCAFAKEKCKVIHAHAVLGVKHYGQCSATQPHASVVIFDNLLVYNHEFCKQIEHFDCHSQPVERICGSDGKTYHTHCDFVKAKCKSLEHSHVDLLISHQGDCHIHATHAHATHALVTTTHAPASTATVSGQSVTMAAIQSHTLTTDSLSSTTTDALTTNSVSATTPATATITTNSVSATTVALQQIMQNVFCRNVNQVNCNNVFSIVCGSDGQYYPNDCELMKASCSNPNLQKYDISVCTATSPSP